MVLESQLISSFKFVLDIIQQELNRKRVSVIYITVSSLYAILRIPSLSIVCLVFVLRVSPNENGSAFCH